MARPRPTPLPEGSTQNMAREEMRLKSSVPLQTEQRKGIQHKTQQHCSLCSFDTYMWMAAHPSPTLREKKKLVRILLMKYCTIRCSCWPPAGYKVAFMEKKKQDCTSPLPQFEAYNPYIIMSNGKVLLIADIRSYRSNNQGPLATSIPQCKHIWHKKQYFQNNWAAVIQHAHN